GGPVFTSSGSGRGAGVCIPVQLNTSVNLKTSGLLTAASPGRGPQVEEEGVWPTAQEDQPLTEELQSLRLLQSLNLNRRITPRTVQNSSYITHSAPGTLELNLAGGHEVIRTWRQRSDFSQSAARPSSRICQRGLCRQL
ncbi:hypothetical protein XENOCAPTIV_029267, partial [Xenoophorus captivus]